MTILRKTAGLVLGMAIGCGVAWAQYDQPQSDQPSLGDVARQKADKKATKSFDDDNFERKAPPPAPADDTAKPKDDAKADAKPADAPPDDVKALEQQLADAKKKRDGSQKAMAGVQGRIDSGALDDDTRGSLADSVKAYQARIEVLNGQIAELEKKLEAAKAAAPKGDSATKPAEDAKPSADAKQ